MKPCPFCGTEQDSTDSTTFTDSQGTKYGAVHCYECGAYGPDVRTGYQDWTHWKDAAIDTWNGRVG